MALTAARRSRRLSDSPGRAVPCRGLEVSLPGGAMTGSGVGWSLKVVIAISESGWGWGDRKGREVYSRRGNIL
eukprot:83956-Hanusia_phi.AAC.1